MTGLSRPAIIMLATWLALAANASAAPQDQVVMLPPTVSGWTRADSVERYAGTDLYLLIDGGADIFLEYGFERVLTSEYAHPSDAIATAELYEMKSPASAYGLFTAFTAGTGKPVAVGQEAVVGNGYCIFWKGTYVGMITAAAVDSSMEPMLLDLAGGVEQVVRQTGSLPEVCARLRRGGFESRSMVYVRGKLALRNQLPQAWATSFAPTEGVVGTSGSSRFLILQYADGGAASTALTSARKNWERMDLTASVDSLRRWTIRQDGRNLILVERFGRHIIAVFGEEPEALPLVLSLKTILADS